MPLAGLGGACGDFAGETRIPADPLLQQRDELRRPDYRVRRHAMMRVKGAAVIHRPLADLDIGEADVDPCRCLGHHVDDGAGGDIAHMRGPLEVGDIECQHHIGAVVTFLRRHAEIERMVARKIEPRIAVPYRRTQGFGDRDHVLPAMRWPGGEIRDDDRALGSNQRIGRVCECHGSRRRRGRHADGTRRGQRNLVIERRLLKSCVVAHVDRPLTAAHHDRVGAGEGVRHAVDGGRLIVPFDDMADRLALNIGGMNPIDEGAPLGFG